MAGGLGVSPRVAATTIEEWAKVVSEEAEKHLPHIAMLKSKGRIKQGAASGGGMRWVVRVKDHTLQAFEDMSPISFERVNTKVNALLPWRGYYMVDAISLREKLEQGGPEAMIKVFSNREEVMRRAALRSLADKFYLDGSVQTQDFHGIESFMGIDTQTATDQLATTTNSTYAGLSTAAGTVDATNTKAWTPVIVNTAHTPTAGLRTWADTADEYLRHAILQSTYGAGPSDRLSMFTLTKDGYEDLLNLLDDKERIPVVRGSAEKLVSMGFSAINFDGVPVIWDAAVPTTDADSTVVSGYGWTHDQMELRLLNSGNLFSSKVTYNDTMATDNIFLYMVGNLKFRGPRHFVKLAAITGV